MTSEVATSGTKKCSKCKKTKIPDAFSRAKDQKDGHARWCKTCVSKNNKAWYKRNKAKKDAQNKAWYENNKAERTKTIKTWRSENPEKLKGYWRSWSRSNPDKVRAKIEVRLERLRKAPGGPFKKERYVERVAYYDNKCAYCEGPYESLDHVIPVSRGGSNWPANIRPCCISCGSSKGTKRLYSEWVPPKDR